MIEVRDQRSAVRNQPTEINRRDAECAERLISYLTKISFEERARRGSRKKFKRAMAKVPKAQPEVYDRLPD
jgi:hypothetical protein